MTRPWRLTRRQRVEMESALAGLRRADRGSTRSLAVACLDGTCWWPDAYAAVSRAWHTYNGSARYWRTLRARVAIALRAALRADEDARCEEALNAVECTDDRYDPEARAWNDGADAAIATVREWPAARYVRHPTATVRAADAYIWPQDHPCADMRVPALVVPLALWERVDFSPAIPRTSATSRK